MLSIKIDNDAMSSPLGSIKSDREGQQKVQGTLKQV